MLATIILLLIIGFACIFSFFLYYKLSVKAIKDARKIEQFKRTIRQRSTFEKVRDVNEKVLPVGFAYEPNQDVFYSVMNGWQKEFGYCRLYDEAAASFYMIIDCEPIYFEYRGQRWLIEFWKGQYGMTSGAEIGIYVADGPDLKVKGVFDGTFYKSVEEEDYLPMSITVWKGNEVLFKRSGWHWWLTGFVVGEFSDPSELTMEIEIIIRDSQMMEGFLKGLGEAGYRKGDIVVQNSTVSLVFGKPKTEQPFTQKSFLAKLKQRRNRKNCQLYHKLTSGLDNTMDKIEYLKLSSPKLLQQVLRIGKTQGVYKGFYKIQNKQK